MYHHPFLWFLLCCLLPLALCTCDKNCPPAEEGKSLTLYCSGSFAMNFQHLIWSSTANEGNTVATQKVSHCNKSMCAVFDKNKYSSSITTHSNTVTSMLKIHTVEVTERDVVYTCMMLNNSHKHKVMCCTMRNYVSPKSAKAPTCQVQLEWGNQINLSCHVVQTYPGISTYFFQFPKLEPYTSLKNKLDCGVKPMSKNYKYYETNCSALISVWSPGSYQFFVVVSPDLDGFDETSNQNLFAITSKAQVHAKPSVRIQSLPEIKLCKHSTKPFVLICDGAWFPSPPRFRWYIDNSFISKGDITTVNQNSTRGYYFYKSTFRYQPTSLNFEKNLKCEAIYYNTSVEEEMQVFHEIKLRSVWKPFDPPYFTDHRGNVLGQLMVVNQLDKTISCAVDADKRHISLIKIECWDSVGTQTLMKSIHFEVVLPLNLHQVLFHHVTSCVCSANYTTDCDNSTTSITFLMKSKHPNTYESKQSYDGQEIETKPAKKSFRSPIEFLYYILVGILACLILTITVAILFFFTWKRNKRNKKAYWHQHPRAKENPTQYSGPIGSLESLSQQKPEDVGRTDQTDAMENIGNTKTKGIHLKESTAAHRTTEASAGFLHGKESPTIIHNLSVTDIYNESLDFEPPKPRPCRPDNSITHIQIPYRYQ